VRDTLIAEDVWRFIHDNINSVEQLEVLLLLRGEPQKQWSAEEVSRRLFTMPASASTRLIDLHARGLLKESGANGTDVLYSYSPGDSRTDDVVSRLDRAYRERKDSVIQIIFSRPADRIQVFSDAFRIRRDG
jgi:hypothetical protein